MIVKISYIIKIIIHKANQMINAKTVDLLTRRRRKKNKNITKRKNKMTRARAFNEQRV